MPQKVMLLGSHYSIHPSKFTAITWGVGPHLHITSTDTFPEYKYPQCHCSILCSAFCIQYIVSRNLCVFCSTIHCNSLSCGFTLTLSIQIIPLCRSSSTLRAISTLCSCLLYLIMFPFTHVSGESLGTYCCLLQLWCDLHLHCGIFFMAVAILPIL